MEPSISWTFLGKEQKGKLWYIIAGALMLGLTFFSFVVGWYMMGVVIIIFCGVYLLYEINTKDEVRVSISAEGVYVDNQFFEITKVRQFGVIYVHGKPQLLRLILAKKVSPQLDLKLPLDIPVSQLREYLSLYIQEDEDMELTLVEHLMFIFRI